MNTHVAQPHSAVCLRISNFQFFGFPITCEDGDAIDLDMLLAKG